MENDVGYTKRKAEKGNRKGLPRATSEGWLTIQQVDRAILLTAIVVVAISLALVVIGGWVIFVLGALSVAAAYLYMGGPKPIAYTPWGELTVFIFFGLIAVNGTYYLQTGTISFISVAASCACGSIASSVSSSTTGATPCMMNLSADGLSRSSLGSSDSPGFTSICSSSPSSSCSSS